MTCQKSTSRGSENRHDFLSASRETLPNGLESERMIYGENHSQTGAEIPSPVRTQIGPHEKWVRFSIPVNAIYAPDPRTVSSLDSFSCCHFVCLREIPFHLARKRSHRRCAEDGCRGYSSFAFPGSREKFCVEHRREGMMPSGRGRTSSSTTIAASGKTSSSTNNRCEPISNLRGPEPFH